MQRHIVTLQENEYRLFQAIEKITLNNQAKDTLIEEFICQIEAFVNSEPLSARDILKLPPKERHKILANQFQEAAQLYKNNSDLIVPDLDVPVDY